MGKYIDIAIDVLKTCGYIATGGVCFYLLSGGKLPFQTSANAQAGCLSVSSMQQFERQSNAMTNNDRTKKQRERSETSQFSDGNPNHFREGEGSGRRHEPRGAPVDDATNRPSEGIENELRRRLSGKSFCRGFGGELTPECLEKMREIEKKKNDTNVKMDSEL